MNLIDFLDRGAMLSPRGLCLAEGDTRLDYPAVQRWSHRIAWALQRAGLPVQARVATLTPNHLWGYVALLGLQRARGIWVPLNGRSSVDDNIAHLRRTGTQWLFYLSEFEALLPRIRAEVPTLQACVCLDADGADGSPGLQRWAAEPEVPPFPPGGPERREDLFRITVSGGTTGAPKAIMQTQVGVECNVATCLALWRYDSPPRLLLTRPMTHAAGVNSLHVLALGGAIHILRKTDLAEVADTVEREHISVLSLAPTTIYSLLARPELLARDWSSLRYLTFGGAPMSAEKLAEAIAVFGPILAQGYAQSEASTLLAAMTPDDYRAVLADPGLRHRLRSCGRPTPFTQIEIMAPDGTLLPPGENGEIVVRSSMVMRGYWGEDAARDAEVSAHGWHHTGDIGHKDADGYVYIVDRLRDVIITGAFNVFPSDVEQVLWGHPAVADCAVIGVPDAHWGEAVKAVVELKPGAQATADELIALCKQQLGSVKAPKSVDFWEHLPRSDVGKVLKKVVRQQYWAQADRKI